ncbi:MAG: hypothetical protein A7315_01895 [Candidatus Altiarchaeales archaeon WOR_SM1_79]|nr:MAG: hypothetical protein A7315_01895 [Candidatus Altiarchaeales archaeon WOR_SM1_79]
MAFYPTKEVLEMILIEHYEKVSVIKLNRDVTNALNSTMIDKLSRILQKLNDDSNVHSIILTSSNEKFFAIGFDIPELFELTKEDFHQFYHSFNQLCLDLYTFPKPTIAAITGHVIAGGCILALCCDYRFIAEGRKLMGFNEIKLGVPVPYPADCILQQLVGTRIARDVMDYGEFFEPEKLIQMGMVDKLLAQDQVLTQALEKARVLGSFSHQAFSMIKRNRVEMVEAQVLKNLDEKERYFVECWYADETREKLKEAMKKF